MKQASVKLPSGEYLIQGLPKGSKWVEVNTPYMDEIVYELDGKDDCTLKLPSSDWQLLGADPTALTEEEAGEIVESWPSVSGEAIRVYQRYPDEIPKCRTPTASLDSLAESLGVSKPYVILKNKTDNNDKA